MLKDILHIRELPEEASGAYNTLAGFVLLNLGHVPKTGEHFEWDGFRFEVIDMDGRRIDKVLVQPKRVNDTDPTNRA
jgi:putative hemolysin